MPTTIRECSPGQGLEGEEITSDEQTPPAVNAWDYVKNLVRKHIVFTVVLVIAMLGTLFFMSRLLGRKLRTSASKFEEI